MSFGLKNRSEHNRSQAKLLWYPLRLQSIDCGSISTHSITLVIAMIKLTLVSHAFLLI